MKKIKALWKNLGHHKIVFYSFFFLIVAILFSQSMLDKASTFHLLNFRHYKYTDQFLQEADKIGTNQENIGKLKENLLNVRAQPSECLSIVNFLDKMTMAMIGTAVAVDLCINDLKVANQALVSMDSFEQGQMSSEEFKTIMAIAGEKFLDNSHRFEQPVVKTAAFIGFSMGLLSILVALVGAVLSLRRIVRQNIITEKALTDSQKANARAEETIAKIDLEKKIANDALQEAEAQKKIALTAKLAAEDAQTMAAAQRDDAVKASQEALEEKKEG